MTESQVAEHEAFTDSSEADFQAAISAGNICNAFVIVKPLLTAIGNLWFLGAKTRKRIADFIAAVDASCALIHPQQ